MSTNNSFVKLALSSTDTRLTYRRKLNVIKFENIDNLQITLDSRKDILDYINEFGLLAAKKELAEQGLTLDYERE